MAEGSAGKTDREELAGWLAGQGADPASFTGLAGDVSARRYFRGSRGGAAGRGGESLILAVYPPELLPACRRFLVTTELLRGCRVAVPAVLACEPERGWMLVEDVGPRTLFELSELPWSRLERYFEEAVAITRRIAALPAGAVAGICPPLDEALLRRELQQTWEELLVPQGLAGDEREASLLRQALEELCRELGRTEPLPCHRDFMARNLVARPASEAEELVVLDHQDLRLGPPCYDLASLLNDSLFPPPDVLERLLARALPGPAERLLYHRAAAQRTLKAVGTFAAFARRGSPRHLSLIPPTFERALGHLERIPETAARVPSLRARRAAPSC